MFEKIKSHVQTLNKETKAHFEKFVEGFKSSNETNQKENSGLQKLEKSIESALKESEKNFQDMLKKAEDDIKQMVKKGEENTEKMGEINKYTKDLIDQTNGALRNLIGGYKESFKELDKIETKGVNPMADIQEKIRDWNAYMEAEVKKWEDRTLGSIGVIPDEAEDSEFEEYDPDDAF